MATFNGTSGSDNSFPTIGTGNVDDVLFGNGGSDKLQGYGGADSIFGGAGDDSLYGNNAPGVAEADLGDFLYGESGDDALFGGDGDDYADPGSGTNSVSGGAGVDTVAYIGSSQAVTVSLVSGTANAGSYATDTLSGVENVAGTNFADAVDGDGNANRISGFGGNDDLDGSGGSDTATFLGSRANYVATRLSGSSIQVQDNRTQTQIDADQVHSVYKVSDGTDTLTNFEFFRFKDATYSLTDLLNNGTAGDDVLTGTDGPDEMSGFAGNDTISGLGGSDLLDGGTQDDSLFGGGADDTLLGRGGDDFLDGGLGADTLEGGGGSDTYVVDDAGDSVIEAAKSGIDTVYASIAYALPANVEHLWLTGNAISGTGNSLDNEIRGNDEDNVLNGGRGDDRVAGGAGRDKVNGGIGDDLVFGGSENDKVFGGRGDDTVIGNLGRDVLTGGNGVDEFRYLARADSGVGANRDVIVDFAHGTERINLRKVDGDSVEFGKQGLKFIGDDHFSGEAGELRATGNVAAADFDGDGAADFQIEVKDVAELHRHDFII